MPVGAFANCRRTEGPGNASKRPLSPPSGLSDKGKGDPPVKRALLAALALAIATAAGHAQSPDCNLEGATTEDIQRCLVAIKGELSDVLSNMDELRRHAIAFGLIAGWGLAGIFYGVVHWLRKSCKSPEWRIAGYTALILSFTIASLPVVKWGGTF